MPHLLKALMRRRLLFALVLGATVFGAVFAFAASLNVGSASLQAGNIAVPACASAVNATYSVAYTAGSGYTVSSVTVNGIDPSCNGKAVDVTLTKADNTSLGSATKPYSSAGGATTLAFAASDFGATPIKASDVADVHAAING